MKIERIIEPYKVRSLCIENEWFTHGTNEEYDVLFQKIDKENEKGNVTLNKVLMIAKYIATHSYDKRVIENDEEFFIYEVKSIAQIILNEASYQIIV